MQSGLVSCNLIMWSWLKLCSATADLSGWAIWYISHALLSEAGRTVRSVRCTPCRIHRGSWICLVFLISWSALTWCLYSPKFQWKNHSHFSVNILIRTFWHFTNMCKHPPNSVSTAISTNKQMVSPWAFHSLQSSPTFTWKLWDESYITTHTQARLLVQICWW